MRFRPRPRWLDARDAAAVARWTAMPDAELGPGLDAEQRLTLAGLLVEVWHLEHPCLSHLDDPSDGLAVDHLPDFVPAPSYEWGRARHPESNVLFWWTRADPYAEMASQLPIDPYEPTAEAHVEVRGGGVVIELADGLSSDDARIEIRRHEIVLVGNEDDPLFLVQAILAFTGWAGERPPYWYDDGDEGVYLVGEILPCASCGEPRETGFSYPGRCAACGERRVGLAVDA